MANKTLKILSLSILFLVVIMSSVSALDISNPTLTKDSTNTILLDITGTPTTPVSFDISYDDELSEIFDGVNINNIDLDDNGDGQADLTYDVPEDFDFEFEKEYSITITADDGTSTVSTTLTFTENTNFYDGENSNYLDISDFDFKTLEGFGDDEDYWYPFDEVEITFNVENDGDYDIEDIEIQVGLWDQEKGKFIFDEDDMEIEGDKFDLDEGDDKDITIKFKVDADKLTSGNTDYTFYVKAIGKIDDSDAGDDLDGEKTGTDYFQSIDIITDDKFVIIDDIEFDSETISCGDTVKLTAKVWNVGDEDLDDDEVYVKIYNQKLNIDKTIEFESGIDAMDYEEITFSFEIPEDIDEGNYVINLKVYDDDSFDDNDLFVTDKEEDEASYQGTFKIEGSCSIIPSVLISASLESDVIAGKDLVVKATITNSGDNTEIYTIDVADFNEWATFISIQSSSVILESGESEDVIITLKVNEGVSGDKLFNIVLIQNDKEIVKQPVSLKVKESESGFPGITGNIISEGNWYLWGIGALNVLLVVIIIIVAFRIAKKGDKKKEDEFSSDDELTE